MPLEITRNGPVALLRINHNAANTLTADSFEGIRNTLQSLEREESVRVLVFAGNEQGYFSNGFAPELFLGKDFDFNLNICRLVNDTALYFFFFPKPIIACLNGHAMGAGAVFALFSDWRTMSEKGARFGFPEAHLGMNFPAFVCRYMQDLIGISATRDILFGGKSLKGAEALALKLVDEIFPEDKIVEQTLQFAAKLAKSPLQVLTGMKRARTEPYRALFESLRDDDARTLATYMTSPIVQEGLLSIVEKRRPRWH